MTQLACGCETSADPPYILYCARHNPTRVLELERLSYSVLTRLQSVYGNLDSAGSIFYPRIAKANASDAMQDLLDEFVPKYRRLMATGSPLPSGGPPPPSG